MTPPTVNCGGLQYVTATLDEARQQHAEAHAHKVVQLQHTVQQDDGQQAAERHIAKLLHVVREGGGGGVEGGRYWQIDKSTEYKKNVNYRCLPARAAPTRSHSSALVAAAAAVVFLLFFLFLFFCSLFLFSVTMIFQLFPSLLCIIVIAV